MNSLLQPLLTGLLVAWAGGYVVWRLWPRPAAAGCGTGCGSCRSNKDQQVVSLDLGQPSGKVSS